MNVYLFIKKRVLLLFPIMIMMMVSCNSNKKKEAFVNNESAAVTQGDVPFFKLSLAQWSLHKAVEDGANPLDFAQTAKELGFEGIEYVSQLYNREIESLGMDALLNSLKEKSEEFGVENVLIMVDGEGDLSSPDEKERDASVEKHKKWVDAAAFLGCHSIRVNTFGTNDPELWEPATIDGLSKLCDYAATKNINVIAENHGWLSSDAPLLMKVIKGVNKTNCGTLPDFGNWCVKRNEGERWGGCLEEYPDMYQGIELMMAAAKGVSAKSHDFDADGNETQIDYKRMLQIVKDAGYTGFIGVEYEGSKISEEKGIIATKNLLLTSAKQLN